MRNLVKRVLRFVEALHEWFKRHEIDTGLRDGMTSEERERIRVLERELKELRRHTKK